MSGLSFDVRLLGVKRTSLHCIRTSAFDPGCVKTHTSAKCGKYNSPIPSEAVGVQHDLTLRMRTSSEVFYARSGRPSFHTTKTRSRRKQEYFAAMHSDARRPMMC